MNVEYCQGYLPEGTQANYWTLSKEDKVKAMDYMMNSIRSNIESCGKEKKDNPLDYIVFTESGEAWDCGLTKEEAMQCISDDTIEEGVMTYRKMTKEEKKKYLHE